MSDLRRACTIDLSYPFHEADTPTARLSALGDYYSQQLDEQERFLSGPLVAEIEQKIAAMLGKASALWCPTGTMAQAIAVSLYAQRSGRSHFFAHPTSHLLLHEESGYKLLFGLDAKELGPWNGFYSPEDLSSDAACALLELPQRHTGGKLPTWEHLNALKKRCNELNVPFHLDGARLWSCRPYYGGRTYAQIANGFSSVYVSLYKDIGALGGAVLASDRDFIEAARVRRTQMGGLLASHWPFVADALRLLDGRIARMNDYVGYARELTQSLPEASRALIDPLDPHTNMFHLVIPAPKGAVLAARDWIAQKHSVWIANGVWEHPHTECCRVEVVVGEKLLTANKAPIAQALSAFTACFDKV